jgi:hypothetical protein
MYFQYDKKKLFNRTLSSLLKWKKEGSVVYKKYQDKPKITYVKYKNFSKYKNINLHKIKKKQCEGKFTFLQAFTIINILRKKIIRSFSNGRASYLLKKNYFWQLYFKLKVLFFSMKMV